MDVLLGAVSSLVVGLTAGYAGVYFALARTRKERVVERRSEWFEELIRTLLTMSQSIEARSAAEAAGYSLRIRSGDFPGTTFRDIVDLRHQLELAPMYASPSTVKILDRFNDAMSQFQRVARRGPDGELFMNATDFANGVAKLTKLLADRLASEYRAHIGMEALPSRADEIDRAISGLVGVEPLDEAELHYRQSRHVDMIVEASEDGGDTWFEVHAGVELGLRVRVPDAPEWKIVVDPPPFRIRGMAGRGDSNSDSERAPSDQAGLTSAD